MPLDSPNLDDRDFNQLLREAQDRIEKNCPQWSDRSAGDPGMVLLDLFAYLTDIMIYRLNRIPEKAYVEFLKIMGAELKPPTAAVVNLVFSSSRERDRAVEIPKGTRVTISKSEGGAETPTFVTTRNVTIDPGGGGTVEVTAYHCEVVAAELVGKGTGQAGQSVQAARPPIVASTGEKDDLLVGVEAASEEVTDRAPAIQHNGKTFRIWSEKENFTDLGEESHVYIVDRVTGTVTFAPALRQMGRDGKLVSEAKALADVPPAGREIRLWYRRGGGGEGNLAENRLTQLKDTIPGVRVTNPKRATGGRPVETLENALLRGPQKLHSLERAVTARDFELVAEDQGGVARAKAFTKASLWAHAAPGTVEVLLVPHISETTLGEGPVTANLLEKHQTEDTRQKIQAELDRKRPLGTTCLVGWARYKTITVNARVVVHRGEDPDAVRGRVLTRLYRTLSPLPHQSSRSGWPFGQPLRRSLIDDAILKEPGVSFASEIRFRLEDVPDTDVRSIALDAFQKQTWYVASRNTLFRSLNGGRSWEPARLFPEEDVTLVRPFHHRGEVPFALKGLLAVATRRDDRSRLYLSRDCGETWEEPKELGFSLDSADWILRDGVPVLLLATDVGLYELAVHPEASPVKILVDERDQKLGFYSVAVATDLMGGVSVAVAARGAVGVYLSSQGGKSSTFRPTGLEKEDIRTLAVQHVGPRSFLWAGVTSAGNEPGKGCFRWELRGAEDPPEGWQAYPANWTGGSCRAIALSESKVIAASHRSGVLVLDLGDKEPVWKAADVRSGLPMRDVGRFQPVDTVALDTGSAVLMAGGADGAYRSTDEGVSYSSSAGREVDDLVLLPQTWLLCSGTHEIEVVSEDEARRD